MRHAFIVLAVLAACSPAAEPPAASAPAAPDTAAIRVAIQARMDQYAAELLAGNAAGVAALFAENGTAAYFGFPTTAGRASIQNLYATIFGIQKVTAAAGTVTAANAAAPGLATTVGTFTETVDSSGTVTHFWWRWAAAYQQGPDGNWVIGYIMAFPDSTHR